MAGYIHDDIDEILNEASSREGFASTKGFTTEQLKTLRVLMEFTWNRGYKSGYQDRDEEND